MHPNLTDAIDGWAASHAGRAPERNPKVIVLLLVLASNLVPTVLGVPSIDGPVTLGQRVAASLIVLGVVGCVGGMAFPRSRPKSLDWGIAVEIGGCMILAIGCFILAAVLGPERLTPLRVTVTLGLGVGCLARAIQIGLYVRGRALTSTCGR